MHAPHTEWNEVFRAQRPSRLERGCWRRGRQFGRCGAVAGATFTGRTLFAPFPRRHTVKANSGRRGERGHRKSTQ